MATHVITKRIQAPEGFIEKAVTKTGTGNAAIDGEDIADDAANFPIVVAIDFSALQSLWIYCDQDLTIKTNSSSTPDDTITLKGGEPLDWQANGYFANPLSADVTSIFVTMDGDEAAKLYLFAIQDATP